MTRREFCRRLLVGAVALVALPRLAARAEERRGSR